MDREGIVYIVMGVTGSGKTTVGRALALRLRLPFHDGDAFHPPANIARMQAGIPLTDSDREPWLRSLAEKIGEWSREGGAVLACSALKESYRKILTAGGPARFILLDPPESVIAERLEGRRDHFMPPSLLKSQLDTLERPVDAIRIEGKGSVEANLEAIFSAIGLKGA